MQRSADRILTTHVGSLAKQDDLGAMVLARDQGETVDSQALAARISSAIGAVVRKQADVGEV